MDLSCHTFVRRERSAAVLEHPGSHFLPEFYEFNLSVANNFTVSASGTFVHGIYEFGAEFDFSSEKFVDCTEGHLIELSDVVDFSTGGHRFPRGLVVGFADRNAVSALKTGGQFLLYAGKGRKHYLFLFYGETYHIVYLLRRTADSFNINCQYRTVFNPYTIVKHCISL